MATNDEAGKFCPIIKSQCVDNCMLMDNVGCSLARGLNGLDSLSIVFNEVDPQEMSNAVTFFSILTDAPMYRNEREGLIPVFRIGIEYGI